MISSHTKQSVPAAELAKRGALYKIGKECYRLEIPANSTTGVGPIGSYWQAEPGEVVVLQVNRHTANSA
jgi:hypothetical protein